MQPSTTARGMAAQAQAEALLADRGYTITERNFRWRGGELDLIAYDGDELVFVEVRSRAAADCGRAEDTIGPAKQAQLARCAHAYLDLRRPTFDRCRFDVVALNGDELSLFRDAFRPRDPLFGRTLGH